MAVDEKFFLHVAAEKKLWLTRNFFEQDADRSSSQQTFRRLKRHQPNIFRWQFAMRHTPPAQF